MKLATHGKCILTGEHAVIRGMPAVVIPLKSRSLSLEWGDVVPHNSDLQKHFEKTLQVALEKINKKTNFSFRVSSDIPSRAGLGSSAALSVAITRFLECEKLASFSKEDQFRFALELENIFHGTSSGIDVAAVLSESPIRFQKGRAEPIGNWQPNLFLSDTGLRSATKACVEKVVALKRPDLDDQMGDASSKAMNAFHEKNNSNLALAIKGARDVFAGWNLIPDSVKKQEEELYELGALAVKPTGSGDGGFLLSLWDKPPISKNLFSIWGDFSKSL